MHLPVGVSDFRELIECKDPAKEGYLYVDKTAFIKEIIYDLTKVIVLTRPRRFGKTLNLSMLQYFFAAEVEGQSTKEIFDHLEISNNPECMEHQGKYPVILISFKDIKQPNFELCIKKIAVIIAKAYRNYRKIFELSEIAKDDQVYINTILEQKADWVNLENSIKRLLELLFKCYNKKPILLIDEYDTPIQEAYLNGYYDELMPFFRNLLSEPLKDDNLLNRAILTGILRVSKESLFSGLSNVEIYSILNENYSNYFGFTENEVNNLLTQAKLLTDPDRIKKWYNGYNFAGTIIYNPWSIIKCIKDKGELKAYWVNTSGNELVKQLIIDSSYNIQGYITKLIEDNAITEYIDEHVVFNDLKNNPESIWSLLLMSGYLKYTSCQYEDRGYLCELKLPNTEVENFYISVVKAWLTGNRGLAWYRAFLDHLINGMVLEFEEKLQTWMIETLSFHDATKKSQENAYHMLLLGLTAGLRGTHIISSNKESGLGRYDLEITPNDPKQLGIILELKVTNNPLKLEEEAGIALAQIKKLNYATNLKIKGIMKICYMGIACSKKAIKIKSETEIIS